MKKVMLRHNEYMATLPPYRFTAGDVIEIEDDWADALIRKSIAVSAPSHAMTAIEKRQLLREQTGSPVEERHYDDMVPREMSAAAPPPLTSEEASFAAAERDIRARRATAEDKPAAPKADRK